MLHVLRSASIAAALLAAVAACRPPIERCTDPIEPSAGEVFVIPGFGTITTLGNLATRQDAFTRPEAINASGSIVGSSDDRCGNPRAFIWSDGAMADLGTLGGLTSTAAAINSAAWVVGQSETGRTAQEIWFPFWISFGFGPYIRYERLAYLWQDGVMTSLGTLLIGIESGATAINAAGQIVGYAGIDPAREEEWAAQSTAHPKR